jgi:CHASE3 domain sensor protein
MITKPQHGLSRVPIVAMLTVSALLVALMAGLSWKNGGDSAIASEESTMSPRIQDATNDLLSTVKDAETGQRGYLLTGNGQYLDSYNSAVAQISSILKKLRDAVSIRPDQGDRERALEPLIIAKMSELASTVDLRRTQGLSPPQNRGDGRRQALYGRYPRTNRLHAGCGGSPRGVIFGHG